MKRLPIIAVAALIACALLLLWPQQEMEDESEGKLIFSGRQASAPPPAVAAAPTPAADDNTKGDTAGGEVSERVTCPNQDVFEGKPRTGPGVVMWTYGRSGSTYFSKAWTASTGDQACNCQKESWNPVFPENPPLTVAGLRGCIERGQLYMHVKPEHLDGQNTFLHEPYWKEPDYWREHPDVLRTPKEFFRGCAQAGFTIVVASFRANWLDVEISGIELACGSRPGYEHAGREANQGCIEQRSVERFCGIKNLTEEWDMRTQRWIDGVLAAEELGLRVVRTNFYEFTAHVCTAVYRMQEQIPELESVPCAKPVRDKSRNSKTTGHAMARETRIGAKADECLLQHLAEENPGAGRYRWMLSQAKPPPQYRKWLP